MSAPAAPNYVKCVPGPCNRARGPAAQQSVHLAVKVSVHLQYLPSTACESEKYLSNQEYPIHVMSPMLFRSLARIRLLSHGACGPA